MSQSTTRDVSLATASRTRGLWGRRLFLSLLAVVVCAGMLELLGVRSRTAVARAPDGGSLSVHYAEIARAGLDVPFTVVVRAASPFDGPIHLAISAGYLGLFNLSGIQPDSSSSTATKDAVVWEFDHPPGTVFTVTLDMTVQASRHWGRGGFVSLLDKENRTILRVSFHTWLAP